MEMTVQDLGNRTTKVALHGRLDTPGVDQVETRFTAAVAPSGKNALVDLSDVSFVSSMGLRMLISVARAVRLRKAQMVLFGAQQAVAEVFEHAALSDIIPVVADERAAFAAVTS